MRIVEQLLRLGDRSEGKARLLAGADDLGACSGKEHFTQPRNEPRARFDALHAERYGHSAPHEPVQVVNLRLRAEATLEDQRLGALTPPGGEAAAARRRTRSVVFGPGQGAVDCPIFARDGLPAGAEIAGPAMIQEYGSATLLHPGDVAVVSPQGHLVVRVAAEGGRQ